MAIGLSFSNACTSIALQSLQLHTARLLVEDITRRTIEENGQNLDRVLRSTNRSS